MNYFFKKKIKNLPAFFLFLFFLVFVFLYFLFLESEKLTNEVNQIFSSQISGSYFSKEKANQIVLFFVGDIMLDRGVEYMIEKYGESDYKFPFLKIADYLKKADVLFGNLEGPISDKGVKVGSIYSFRHQIKAIEGLVFAGFDILSVANNHVFDYGREAMEDNFLRLRGAGIDYLGGGFNKNQAHSAVIKNIKGIKIAYLGYNNLGSPFWSAAENKSGIAWLEKEQLKEDIAKAKAEADLVIISFHFGQEYQTFPSAEQKFFAQLAIDYGADLVVGHHPHVVQPIEKYQSGYIAYSLGNFIFDQGFSKETMRGIILKVIIKGKEIKEVIPVDFEMNQYFQPEKISLTFNKFFNL